MAQPFLDGKCVELCFFSEADAEALSSWYYDFNYRFFFREFLSRFEPEDFKKLGANLKCGGVDLITIKDLNTKEKIGLMTFVLEKFSAQVYKFGIMLDVNHQGKTWAIDSIIVLGMYLFRVKKAHKLVVEFCDKDEHIHRITKKGGFTHEATLKEELLVNGIYYDEARYSMGAAVYEKLYGDYLKIK